MKGYKCSCCNEMKTNANVVWKKWDSFKRPGDCGIVGICRKCNNDMKKVQMNRVESYKELLINDLIEENDRLETELSEY